MPRGAEREEICPETVPEARISLPVSENVLLARMLLNSNVMNPSTIASPAPGATAVATFPPAETMA
jgi:hypothetical protein